MGQIASECDAAAAPAERRKSAHFQQKVAIFLAKLRGLAPIVDLQARNNRVLRQRGWIKQPRVGNDVLELNEIFFAQFASPKFAQWLKPKKREPHFLLQIRFDRRRNRDASVRICAQRLFDVGNIWQIEQLKKPIHVVSSLGLVILRRHDAPALAGIGDAGRREIASRTGVSASGYSSSLI